MKKLMIVGLFMVAGTTTYAQTKSSLAGTAWQGQVYAPQETTVIFQFKADSVYMLLPPDMTVAETMMYTAKADTLTLKKISGNSPCGPQETGVLLFKVNTDEMTFKPLTDGCEARKAAWIDKPFRKVAVNSK